MVSNLSVSLHHHQHQNISSSLIFASDVFFFSFFFFVNDFYFVNDYVSIICNLVLRFIREQSHRGQLVIRLFTQHIKCIFKRRDETKKKMENVNDNLMTKTWKSLSTTSPCSAILLSLFLFSEFIDGSHRSEHNFSCWKRSGNHINGKNYIFFFKYERKKYCSFFKLK